MASAESSAPGRVNLIGEHTDYNGGLVLPAVIPLGTTVRIATRDDGRLRLRSESAGGVDIAMGDRARRGSWSDYVVGVVVALERRGLRVPGFDAEITSDIPLGAGLASSAALMVATLRALRVTLDLALDDRQIADVAHDAETEFVGARVGRMDQLVCSIGREGEALFVDLRSGEIRPISLSQLDAETAVIDSGIRHEHAGGAYNTRRAECDEAARRLGVTWLRDAPDDADLSRLPAALARRVRHVMSENARVRAAVDAIGAGDAGRLGQLFNASHDSLRDDFEVSVPAIDAIVAAARRGAGCYGARITGGGFGGCVILLARKGTARGAALRAVAASGRRGSVPLPMA